ncbi:MAG: alpha/beta hydrolase, partial [Acidimicrobiales bacterium]
MPRSLPGAPDLQLGALRGLNGWTGRVQRTATNVGLKVIPRIPSSAMRLLAGGRSVSIDGNTLDPTLQLTFAAQRASGVNGLAVDDDV